MIMTKRQGGDPGEEELHREAESRLAGKREPPSVVPVEDAPRLVHELQVHQIELEMQNEELRKSQDAIAALLEKYLNLYDFAPVGYFTLDASGVIRQANLTGASFLAVPRGEIMDKRLAAFLEPESRPALAAFLAEIMAGVRTPLCEVRVTRADRAEVFVQMRGAAFELEAQCRIAMVDVTERNRAENLVLQYQAHLEELVRERSAELLLANESLKAEVVTRREAGEAVERLNTQLQEGIAQSLATNRELDAFSYSVSHDLRAPLRAINSFAQMLAKSRGDEMSEEERRLLEVIRTNAVRLGSLIDDLIRFSRMGRMSVVRKSVSIKALAESVVVDLVPESERERTFVRVGDLAPALGDTALLHVVLENLLANALKFSSGKPVREIEVGSREEDGQNVYFVRDNGVGFDPRYVGKLFGVFQRLHGHDEFEGTGIGLALCKRIVERHGGHIWAEGEIGRGATIFFSLPQPA